MSSVINSIPYLGQGWLAIPYFDLYSHSFLISAHLCLSIQESCWVKTSPAALLIWMCDVKHDWLPNAMCKSKGILLLYHLQGLKRNYKPVGGTEHMYLSTTNNKTLLKRCSLQQAIRVWATCTLWNLTTEMRKTLCFPSGADVILDFVGASYWENHTKCVSVDGRIVLLGLVRATVHMHCMLFLPLF